MDKFGSEFSLWSRIVLSPAIVAELGSKLLLAVARMGWKMEIIHLTLGERLEVVSWGHLS